MLYTEKCGKLDDEIDGLNLEIHHLRETLAEKEAAIRNLKTASEASLQIASEVRRKANHYEQYSQKKKIKIFGIKEERNEKITTTVCEMLKSVGEVDLRQDEILAIHRLPSKVQGATRRVILKVKNTEIK